MWASGRMCEARHFQKSALLFVALLIVHCSGRVVACPFCSAIKPTLVQQRETATEAFLGECIDSPPNGKAGKHGFRVLHGFSKVWTPATRENVTAEVDRHIKAGTLVLMLGERASDESDSLEWQAIPLNEVSFGYLSQAPDSRIPSNRRLAYFARFLEHRDPLIAEDAFNEFGHAPYESVKDSAANFDAAKLRAWIADPTVPTERKGFYGLALGLTAKGNDRNANVSLLKKLIEAETKPGDDFRSGFDGILGGYLVATGLHGIEFVSKKLLTNPEAAVGDVRHAHKALRFYHEFGPPEHRSAVISAVQSLLNRPSDAASAIADLARWQDWEAQDRIVAIFDQKDFAATDIRRAIVGYLRACPLPAAEQSLERLRNKDPKAVAAAEAGLDALTGK